jgi:hypothetical protein
MAMLANPSDLGGVRWRVAALHGGVAAVHGHSEVQQEALELHGGHADLSKRKARGKGGAVTALHAEPSSDELRHGGRRRRRPIRPPHLRVWLKDGTTRKSKGGRRLGRDKSRGGAAVARSGCHGDGAAACAGEASVAEARERMRRGETK